MKLKTALILIALALGVRALIISASLASRAAGLRPAMTIAPRDLTLYAALHDGREYQQIARALDSPPALRDLPPVTRRLAPGYPATIRLVAFMAPLPLAALAVSLLSAAVAVALFHRLTRDPWLSACFAVFTPSWLLYSSLAMSEALFLALALAGFLLWRGGRPYLAALVFGALTLVRPVGVLVFGACWLVELIGGRRKRCLPMAACYALAPLLWMAAAWAIWRDPWQQFHAYVAKDFSLPFVSLVNQTLAADVSLAKKALVWFTLLTNGLAIALLLRRFVESRSDEKLAWLLWCAACALFFLALPSNWAFGSLDRFFIASLPPMLVGLRGLLPRRWWGVAFLAAADIAVCLYWNIHMFQAVSH